MQKGQDLFLKAYEQLNDDVRKKIKITIVGEMADQKIGAAIIKAADKYENLECLDSMPQEDLIRLMASYDGVIVCSRDETVSMVAVEAMCLGKCVISSDSVGATAYIDDGVSGYVYETYDTGALTKLLEKVSGEERSEVERVGREARKIYEQHFSISSFDKRIDEVMFGGIQ